MLAAVLALSLSSHPAPPQPPPVATRSQLYGGWRLRVTRDAFAGRTTCRVGRRDAEVEHGRLLWRMGAGVDTSAAVWRIDAGEPRRQSLLDLPASANLGNPSDGRLSAPAALLSGAQVIEARATPHGRVRRLEVARLDEALAAAAAQGCAPL